MIAQAALHHDLPGRHSRCWRTAWILPRKNRDGSPATPAARSWRTPRCFAGAIVIRAAGSWRRCRLRPRQVLADAELGWHAL